MGARCGFVDQRARIPAVHVIGRQRSDPDVAQRRAKATVRSEFLAAHAARWIEGRNIKPRTRLLYVDLLERHIAPTRARTYADDAARAADIAAVETSHAGSARNSSNWAATAPALRSRRS